jgi:hypothetical protein
MTINSVRVPILTPIITNGVGVVGTVGIVVVDDIAVAVIL